MSASGRADVGATSQASLSDAVLRSQSGRILKDTLTDGSTAADSTYSYDAGCAAGPTVDDDLYAYLSPREHHSVTEIDFDKVIPGSWTKLVIVCAGATKNELDKELGFDWKDAPSLRPSSNFIAMVVFARKNDVESFDNVGSDPFIEGEWYFTPCTSDILGDPDTAEPLSIPRARSKVLLTLHKSDSPHFWYVSKQEFQRLRNVSKDIH